MIYTDDSWMPFGKYGPEQGDRRRLRDVPASYMLWLWEDAKLWDGEQLRSKLAHVRQLDDTVEIQKAQERLALHVYIGDKSTFRALEMDASNVIVKHPPA